MRLVETLNIYKYLWPVVSNMAINVKMSSLKLEQSINKKKMDRGIGM